jgi:hypothetical protein
MTISLSAGQLRSALVRGTTDAHFENRLWFIKIVVQRGLAL